MEKMKKANISFLIITILFFNVSCEWFAEGVYSIRIYNNSNDTVRYYESYNYPDTSLSHNKPILIGINPQDYGFWDSKKEWKKVLVSPHDTASIFFLRERVYFDNWDEIKNEYHHVLKRYDLSLPDLQRLKWEVFYPPTEAMKDMKMYPPYGK